MIRAFVAIDLPREVRDELAVCAERLRRVGLDGRFVKTASLHLTLKFLGNIDPDQVPPITSLLKASCRESAAFQLNLGPWGVFPHARRPRAVWIGVQGLPPLLDLQRKVGQALLAQGFAAETRPFRPHLTLFRLKSQRKAHLLDRWLESETPARALPFSVCEVHLYRSHLHPDGAEYESLARAPLRAATAPTATDAEP